MRTIRVIRAIRGSALAFRSRSRSPAEQFAAIGQFDGTAICNRPSRLGTKACNFDFSSGLDRVHFPTEPDQSVRRGKWTRSRPELKSKLQAVPALTVSTFQPSLIKAFGAPSSKRQLTALP